MAAVEAIAIIPARGGSKRIPRKNIKPFLGVPLLARTIGILREAEVFQRIVVSTDDDEIAAVAQAAGGEAPFRRPPDLANDHAATLPVIEHAVRTLAQVGVEASFVCCVYPAAVLARAADLSRALAMLRAEPINYVFTATAFSYPIQRALRKTANGGAEMFWPEHRQTRSQDLEPAYHDAGQYYFGRSEAWLEQRPLFARGSRLLVIPHYRAQDIDTPEDWERAELIFEALQRRP
jgi:N-acylneuraminate cytidylyltransferase